MPDAALLSAAMASVIDGVIVMDDAGIIHIFNRAAECLLGYKAEDVLGNHIRLLLPEPYNRKSESVIGRYLSGGIDTLLGSKHEVTAMHKNGTAFQLEIGLSDMRLEGRRMFVSMLYDISRRKEMEEALRKNEERYELLVHGSNVIIWDWDIVTDTIYWSPHFKEILHCPQEEPVDRFEFWKSRLHPEDGEQVMKELNNHINHEGGFDVEYRIRREDGTYAWVHSKGQAVWDYSGKALRMVGALEEITWRKQAEQNLKKAYLDHKQSNEELESFTYIASHDLRSPLVNLKGFSEELRHSLDAVIPLMSNILANMTQQEQAVLQKEVLERVPKALSYIISSAEKMDRLTSTILQLSRVGHREIVLEPIDTQELVQSCLKALDHQIQKNHVTLDVASLPPIVGDKISIEQVFGNLLDNAVKYLDPTRPGKIWITATTTPSQVIFCVQDNGRGIAKDDIHKVFEIFRRAGDVEDIPGEGMGMPYVRAIVRRHGGNIWCESNPGQGTAFHFTIARADTERLAA